MRLLQLLILISLSSQALSAKDLIPVISNINLSEESAEPGFVSTQTKKFNLVIEHDGTLIPAEKLETFDRKTSPLLTNLNIIKRDLNRKQSNRKSLRDDFEFSLVEDSQKISENIYRTSFVSNDQIIKKAQRLNFRFDLFNYLDQQQTIDTSSLETTTIAKIEIKALELDLINLSTDQNGLEFTALKPDKKESKITTENIIVNANFESSANISNVIKRLKFKTRSDTDKKIAAKIKLDGSRTEKLRVKPIASADNLSISSNGNLHSISFPLSLESKNKLTKAQRSAINSYDLLILPVYIDIKTGDSLDLNLSGILREKQDIKFTSP